MSYRDKNIFFVWGIGNFSTCGIDKTFMSVLGIDNLSIFDIDSFLSTLYMDNTSTYDIYKIKLYT